MGVRLQLSDEQWLKIEAFLEADYTVGEPGADDRNFIEAVLWWRRAGAPWRDLPAEFGPWKTVFNRFDRWSRNGSIDSIAGRGTASGTECFAPCEPTWTTNGIVSTARSTEPTSIRRAERGGGSERNRPIARRPNDQGPPRRRCAWLAGRVRSDRR